MFFKFLAKTLDRAPLHLDQIPTRDHKDLDFAHNCGLGSRSQFSEIDIGVRG